MENLKQLFFFLYANYSVVLQVAFVIFFIISLTLLHKNKVLRRKLKKVNSEFAQETARCTSVESQNLILARKCASNEHDIRNLNQRISKLSQHNETLQESLKKETFKYNELLSKVNNEKILREQKRQDFFEQQKESKSQQDYYIDLANQKLDFCPEQIICLRKKVFMNEEESRKYYHICEEFKDEAYKKKYGTSRIYVFAQVALHSIFERTQTGIELDNQIQDTYIRRFFLSKSIDYLVCAAYYDEHNHYYQYKPILGIEIDGKYHDNPDVRKRDQQKEGLFQAVNIPFLRFSLEENQGDKMAIRTKIRELLLL